MCGIAGIININREKTNQATHLLRMVGQMKKRGPDDEGFILINSQNNQVNSFFGKDTPRDEKTRFLAYYPKADIGSAYGVKSDIALGHRRLSILDLSFAGHQPMCTEDGRYWIIYNGEVYNFREIRQELEKEGDAFFSSTDTEVVLKAYRKWGTESLCRFNGMWAFAIWDNQEKILFCSRDRIGIKPFYYYLTNNLFLFASDIKTLIASGLYIPQPNWEGVYHNMSFYCAPRPMTCFKGVNALEQAHWMTINLEGRIQKARYWHIPVGEIDYSKSEDKWIEEIEYGLNESVSRRLIADVSVGTFMSGGIDSTTISALAAKNHAGIKAFTLAYEKQAAEYDELPQAKAIAKMYPMEHIIKKVSPEETLPYLEDMVLCYEEPFYSLSPNYLISKLVTENKIKVVLGGLGGDELFCGYRREKFFRLWKIVGGFEKIMPLLPSFNKDLVKLKELALLKDIYEYYVCRFSTFVENEKHILFGDMARVWNSYGTFKSLYRLDRLRFCDSIEALCYMDMINYIGNHHVYRVDQFTMNFSVEGRFPFLDHEVVELACRIPSELKVHRGVGKYILRKLSKKLIHPSCLAMKKKGFGLPVGYWMRSSLKSLVVEKINKLKRRGVMDAKAIDNVKSMFEQRKADYRRLWFLVSLELWLENLVD